MSRRPPVQGRPARGRPAGPGAAAPILPLLLLLACSHGAAAPSGSDLGPEGLDLESMLEEARRVQEADIAAWSRYQFRRHLLKQHLDSDGRATRSEEVESIVTPLPAGDDFDETLVRLNGEEPGRQQLDRHRKDSPFTRHYRTLREGEEGDGAGYSLAYLLRMSSYTYAGREQVDGTPCHRIDFEPTDTVPDSGVPARFVRVMSGSIWLTTEGLHIQRASVRSEGPVNIVLAIIRLSHLEAEIENQPVDGIWWLPRRIDMRSRVRVLGVPIRRRHVYTYTDFSRVAPLPEREGNGATQPPPGR